MTMSGRVFASTAIASHDAVGSRLRAPSRLGSTGFTLIELITSLVIIGILGAVAAPRFFDDRAFNERGYIDEVAFTLRYAQKIAIASQCNVSVTTNANGYVALQRAAAGPTCSTAGAWIVPVLRIDGSPLSGTPPAAVVLAPDAVIEFDSGGGVAGGAAPPVLGIGIYTLTVDPISGVVSVQP